MFLKRCVFSLFAQLNDNLTASSAALPQNKIKSSSLSLRINIKMKPQM